MFKAYKYYWQNAFKYRSTSSRADFWWPVLVNVIIYLILYLLLAIVGYASVTSIMNGYANGAWLVMFLLFVMGVFTIANIFPGIAISIRRFRDIGLSGWAVLVFWLLSIIFSSEESGLMNSLLAVVEIIQLVLYCLPSGYLSKRGWWSPNYDNDIQVPSLRNEN
ncbi:DUF805 domain-containing protein [Limosilactobacillus sp. STM2_1]|uniref:DUF805 domain-containing protein n=1 Tax=Limosilactobacillus rudii TaxID=2759755 RepID=A0A7W3UK54_9LACO|nr:DUF805 domain-containing protein [Limosilactobacillus rudii]MBB1079129.1 DUF805 domain-containing protein [Limosilactobacillus rudii]MBB1096996.1 DUF805 domain-containing protein [Limosilactobacillus rudii]MCD7133964.1 DUF805 domain-containing protein [Limosilactobacillus rudii]